MWRGTVHENYQFTVGKTKISPSLDDLRARIRLKNPISNHLFTISLFLWLFQVCEFSDLIPSDRAGFSGLNPCRTGFSGLNPCRTGFSVLNPCRTGFSDLNPCRTGFSVLNPCSKRGFSVLNPCGTGFSVLNPCFSVLNSCGTGFSALSPGRTGFSVLNPCRAGFSDLISSRLELSGLFLRVHPKKRFGSVSYSCSIL